MVLMSGGEAKANLHARSFTRRLGVIGAGAQWALEEISQSGYTIPMCTIEERKRTWLGHCGLNNSEQDRKLRDRVTALFDIETPTRLQQKILARADVRKSLLDLPANAFRQQHQELMSLIRQEILIDRLKKLAWLGPIALVILGAAAFLTR